MSLSDPTRTSDCELTQPQIILATQFNSFEKGKDTQEIFGALIGSGVFGADGVSESFLVTIVLLYFSHRPNRRLVEVSVLRLFSFVSSLLDRFHRAMTRPFFKRERVSDFELFDRHALAAIAQLKMHFAEGHPVDFQVCTSHLPDNIRVL